MSSLRKRLAMMGVIYSIGFILGFRSMIEGHVGLIAFLAGLITFFVFLFGFHEIGRQITGRRKYMMAVAGSLTLILIICGANQIAWENFLEQGFQIFASVIGNPVLLPFFWVLSSIWGDEAEMLQTVLINAIPCVFLFVAALSGVLRGRREKAEERDRKEAKEKRDGILLRKVS